METLRGTTKLLRLAAALLQQISSVALTSRDACRESVEERETKGIEVTIKISHSRGVPQNLVLLKVIRTAETY